MTKYKYYLKKLVIFANRMPPHPRQRDHRKNMRADGSSEGTVLRKDIAIGLMDTNSAVTVCLGPVKNK